MMLICPPTIKNLREFTLEKIHKITGILQKKQPRATIRERATITNNTVYHIHSNRGTCHNSSTHPTFCQDDKI